MLSRVFLKVRHATVMMSAVAVISTSAVAQIYGGGGGMGAPGTPGAMHPSYGSKTPAVVGGIAGAGAGASLLYWSMHNRATLLGCVGGDGNTLANEKDNRTYTLVSKREVLKPGERVEVKGKKLKDESGASTFEVHKISKELGSCTPTTAEKQQ